MRVLLRLSEGAPVEPELYADALEQSDNDLRRVQIGYVVIDQRRARRSWSRSRTACSS